MVFTSDAGYDDEVSGGSVDSGASVMAADSCGGCGSCNSCCQECCEPFWAHRCGVFGEYLYLHARDVDLAYAIPLSGIAAQGSVPVGPVGVADPDYEPGYRVGGSIAFNRCSSVTVSYTHYESHTFDQIRTGPTTAPFVIHSLLVDPNTASAASDSLVAQADYDIDFELADAAYRRVFRVSKRSALNYSVGARYGHLDQELLSAQPISPGVTTVLSDISFDGGGALFGLDGEQLIGCRGFSLYAKGAASFLAGSFHADYLQRNTFAQVQSTTRWEDDRIVPILEYELGAAWTGKKGHLRLAAGYTMMAWYNSVTTGTFVQAVQNRNFVDVEDTLTFDGVVGRAEFRW
jgi:hypothetical protein